MVRGRPEADARDGLVALGVQRGAAVDGGGADQREQVGLGCRQVIEVGLARQVSIVLESARCAPVQSSGELDDVLLLEHWRGLEPGRESLGQTAISSVELERVQVQIDIDGAAEALHEDHSARTWAGAAVLPGPQFR